MRPGERPISLILSFVTILLALVIGIAIPIASGGEMRDLVSSWTPPPTRTATPTLRAFTPPTLAPLASPTAAPQPTAALPTATPTVTPTQSVTPTATPSPPATFAPTASPTPSVTPTATPAGPTARMLAEPVNLRSGPGTDFAPLGIARLGEVYALRGRNADGTWYQVCCVRGATAWVSATLVSTEGITDTLPIVP